MAEWTAGKGTTALGIIGTSLGGLAVAGGNLMGNLGVRTAAAQDGCSVNHLINRHESSQAARRQHIHRQQNPAVYQYVDGKLDTSIAVCASRTYDPDPLFGRTDPDASRHRRHVSPHPNFLVSYYTQYI